MSLSLGVTVFAAQDKSIYPDAIIKHKLIMQMFPSSLALRGSWSLTEASSVLLSAGTELHAPPRPNKRCCRLICHLDSSRSLSLRLAALRPSRLMAFWRPSRLWRTRPATGDGKSKGEASSSTDVRASEAEIRPVHRGRAWCEGGV